MSSFALFVWLGGTIPAYRHARRNGHNVAVSLLNAAAWPTELGWYVADIVCKEDKG